MKEEKRDISKLTKVLIKDLKGERIIYQDSLSGRTFEKEKVSENRRKRTNKNYTWSLAWRILLIIFIIDFSIISYFKFYKNVGVVEGLNGWVTYTRNKINGKEKKEYQSVKNAHEIYKKKIIKKDEKIYSWEDKEGKTHYSNIMPIGVRKNKIQEAELAEVERVRIANYGKNNKKEEKILKYIVYLNEGGTFECMDVTTNENILIFYTEKGIIMNLDKQKIKKIEKYQMVNNKLKVTSWNPFKKG